MTTQKDSPAPGSTPAQAAKEPLPLYFSRRSGVYRSAGDDAEAVLVLAVGAFSDGEDKDADADMISMTLNGERAVLLAALADGLTEDIRLSVMRLPLDGPVRTIQMSALTGLALGLARVLGFPGDLRRARQHLQERGIVIP
jgi:hypothetical protein